MLSLIKVEYCWSVHLENSTKVFLNLILHQSVAKSPKTWLKGTVQWDFRPPGFFIIQPAWATDQWVKIFPFFMKISLSYLVCFYTCNKQKISVILSSHFRVLWKFSFWIIEIIVYWFIPFVQPPILTSYYDMCVCSGIPRPCTGKPR